MSQEFALASRPPRVYVGIYGKREFIEAALTGLELEEWQPAEA